MIDLYYWPTPNGWKISIFLEECEIPYNLVPVNIGAGDQFDPAFLKISPNHRMPAIVDHDVEGDPISVFESGAILQYLAEKTGRFLPTDIRGRVEVLEWLFWQMANLGPMLGQVSHFVNYAPQIADIDHSYALERYRNEGQRLFRIMDERLATRDYLAGEYSIADMASWAWIKAVSIFGEDLDVYPHLTRWLEAIGERPAVEKGWQVGKDLRDRNARLSEEAKTILFGQT